VLQYVVWWPGVCMHVHCTVAGLVTHERCTRVQDRHQHPATMPPPPPLSGDIYVNGTPKDQRTWSRTLGYVEQFDQHSPLVTVVEALWFSARLRLPASVPDARVGAGPAGWRCRWSCRHG
jgi:hypothetical protein